MIDGSPFFATSSRTNSQDQLVDRIYEAARLRGLAYFNDYDSNHFPRCSIRYYVDPAVALSLFLWPGRLLKEELHNQNYLATISEANVEKKVVEAVLTGERIFSRTAGEADGDDSPGVFMMPDHWIEFTRKLKSFFTGPADPKQFLERFDREAFTSTLEEAEKIVSDEQGEATDGTSAPFRLSQEELDASTLELSKAVAAIEHTRFMEVAMVSRLRHNKLVRPPTDLLQAIYRPETEHVNEWTRLLKDKGKSGAIRADATVLTQLEMLNRIEQKKAARGDDYTLHCLITGDLHVHRAFYAQRFKWANSQPLGMFGEYDEGLKQLVPDWDGYRFSRFMQYYTLRHPAQFVAMLNQQALDNRISNASLFTKVVKNTEYQITSVSQTESRSLLLATDAVRGVQKTRRTIAKLLHEAQPEDMDGFSAKLVETFRDWRRMTGTTFLINRATLRDRVRATRQAFEHMERDPDSYLQILEDIQCQLFDEFDETALHFTAHRMLAEMRDTASKSDNERRVARRMHARLLIDLTDITGDMTLLDVLKAYEAEDIATIDHIEHEFGKLPVDQSWRTLLFCAIMAARVSGWERLVWIGGRALNAIGDQSDHVEEAFEARYAVALGMRLRLKPGDFQEAQALLQRAERHHRDRMEAAQDSTWKSLEAVRLARALSELATLRLFEQSRQLMMKSDLNYPDINPLDGQLMLEVPGMFSEALELVEDVTRFSGDDRDAERLRRVARFVQRQATLNLPLFSLLGHVVFKEDPEFEDTFNQEDFIGQVKNAQLVWSLGKTNTDILDEVETVATEQKEREDNVRAEVLSDLSRVVEIDFHFLSIGLEGEEYDPDALKKLQLHKAEIKECRAALFKEIQGNIPQHVHRPDPFELALIKRMFERIIDYYEKRARAAAEAS